MYPRGQPGLPNNPVTAYVDGLRTTGAALGSSTTRRARTTRHHDPRRECNVCVASASSSSELEPAPRHRGADTQRLNGHAEDQIKTQQKECEGEIGSPRAWLPDLEPLGFTSQSRVMRM
jgi:hypothetical protein